MDDPMLAANLDEDAEPVCVKALAFITMSEVEKETFRGGVLVTDSQGKPLEFRCTSPMKPTTVQKTLYGSTLRPHMAVELVGRPLLSSLKEKVDAILVEYPEFVALRDFHEMPLLLVSRQGSTITTQDNPARSATSELLSSASGRFDPLVVTCHWDYEADLPAVSSHLGSIFSRFDLLEPFERVATALKLLHNTEKR